MIKKTLAIAGIAVMLVLLVMGPKMGKVSQKTVAATPDTTTTHPVNTDTPDTSSSLDTDSTSVYDSTPITLPDGSVLSLPSSTLTAPTSSSTKQSSTTGNKPDPAVCTSAQAAIAQIQDTYAAQDQPLQAEIKSLQDAIMAQSQWNPGNYGSGYTPPDLSGMQAKLQADNNKLSSNVQQMNSQLAPYQQQVAANCH